MAKVSREGRVGSVILSAECEGRGLDGKPEHGFDVRPAAVFGLSDMVWIILNTDSVSREC